jgi:hypothetical protein
MVTGESFAFQDNLILLSGWLIEAGHKEVKIGSESTHHSHFFLRSAHDWGHQLGSSSIDIDEWRKQFIFMRHKMTGYTLGSPGSQILLDISSSAARLNTERVAA